MALAATALAALLAAPATAAADFVWGAAGAAYQTEGYRAADGRRPSVWDAFDTPGLSSVVRAAKPSGRPNVFRGENAASTDEDYVRYPQTVQLHRDLGLGATRLSLSWPRMLAYDVDGDRLRSSRIEAGIAHYRSVLQAYRSQGVLTAVTLFHWDTPLAIEEFAATQPCGSAWLCHEWLPALFAEYAALALHEYGGLVDFWLTINEPHSVVTAGYTTGDGAPGRCSKRNDCWAGNSSTEPYAATKGLVLAHAAAFRAWERAGRPGRSCGIVLSCDWHVPATDATADRDAASRSMDWQVSIFADPIHFGRWPQSVVDAVGERLPPWTAAEKELVQGSHDDYAFVNHYTSQFARGVAQGDCGWNCDISSETSGYSFATGRPIGTPSSNGWLFAFAPGFGQLLKWYDGRYPGRRFIITENGWGNATANREEELGVGDRQRCNYYREYLGNLSAIAAHAALRIEGYFAWALLDNYEWTDGVSVRFGLTYVDFATQARTPKPSAMWFKRYITPLRQLPIDGAPLPPCDAVFGNAQGREAIASVRAGGDAEVVV